LSIKNIKYYRCVFKYLKTPCISSFGDFVDIKRIREDFPALQRKIGGKPIVYFDNACMSFKPNQVLEAMEEYYKEFPACAGRSIHRLSSMVEERMEDSRKKVQKHIGAKKSGEVIFTRNTTEGLNLVSRSLGLEKGDVVLTSDREHNSNLIPWHLLAGNRGVVHRVVRSNPDGTFSLEGFEKSLGRDVRLVSIVHTSNLDGYTLPVKEIIKISHDNGSLVMLDGAQAMPHSDVNVRGLDADFYAFSGHKMLGPTGTGVLYGKEKLLKKLNPFMVGGETVEYSTYEGHRFLDPPQRFEAGLQDYAGIIGLGAAVKYLEKVGKDNISKHEKNLNGVITSGISDTPGLRIIGPQDPGMRGGIISFTIDGIEYHDIAMLLDNNANIMIRSGQHCVHSWFHANRIKGSARASLYLYNTGEEAERFIEELKKVSGLR
jgi:cysteine desulfurase/selenocysteine lyase